MSDYRVTVKVRNGRLLRAINNSGYQSIPKFCEAAGVQYTQINDLINMTASPLDRHGKVRPVVESVMEFLCEPFDALFSEAQCEALTTNKSERDVSAEQMFALLSSEQQDPLELLQRHELANEVRCVLSRLTPRYRAVMLARMDEGTHEEIGKMLDVSRERSRQMEAIAQREIRVREGGRLKQLRGAA